MIKNLHITHYRKLKNTTFEFRTGVNVISGTNGTCKTSILHLMGNSFQPPKNNTTDPKCISIIKNINNKFNPKVENLTKGDKTYNDPAIDVRGVLYKATYIDETTAEFRRHNTKVEHRFRLILPYGQGRSQSLKTCPVIYLGLGRLTPFGEFSNDGDINKISKQLPDEYLTEIYQLYSGITGIEISGYKVNDMASIKTRGDFVSNVDGIDSNTVSAGEDNILIILSALVSLKYYYENITSSNSVESVLLIDELDATLHPSTQNKILDKLVEYANNFKIQIVFTTHSLSLIEYSLKKSLNLLYLKIVGRNVNLEPNPKIIDIKMHLYNKLRNQIYGNVRIPVFTEDAEARVFLNIILDKFQNDNADFIHTRQLLHLVGANLGAGNLKSIFEDVTVSKEIMQGIGVFDGDQQNYSYKYQNQQGQKPNQSLNLMTLPTNKTPESLAFEHAQYLFDNNTDFWSDVTVNAYGYTTEYFRTEIKPNIDQIQANLNQREENGDSTDGVRRERSKSVFNSHIDFFKFVLKNWVSRTENSAALNSFKNDLKIMFCRVRSFYGIDKDFDLL